MLKPKLTEEQKKQLMECFELMDADGSGAIDSQELGNAFKVGGVTADIRMIQLGWNASRKMLQVQVSWGHMGIACTSS